MLEQVPQLLTSLEGSGVAQAIRQSVWIYPVANVLHIVALAVFAGAVTAMDLRLLGAFAASRPGPVLIVARRATIIAFLAMLASGAALFAAEASHVARNPVFQIKMALVVLGLGNALLLGRMNPDWLAAARAYEPLPGRLRLAAGLSLLLWLLVVACGRLIAYV